MREFTIHFSILFDFEKWSVYSSLKAIYLDLFYKHTSKIFSIKMNSMDFDLSRCLFKLIIFVGAWSTASCLYSTALATEWHCWYFSMNYSSTEICLNSRLCLHGDGALPDQTSDVTLTLIHVFSWNVNFEKQYQEGFIWRVLWIKILHFHILILMKPFKLIKYKK